MSSIRERADDVRARIAEAARTSGRSIDEITLLGASKTVEFARIAEAYSAGIADFGENYAQELVTKSTSPELSSMDIRWHMIGHVQRNKARLVVNHARLIHSVDSVQIAASLARYALDERAIADILIELKVDDSPAKTGVEPSQLDGVLDQIRALPGVRIQGLMGLAPFTGDETAVRSAFRRFRSEFDKLPINERHVLSMGMSSDFEWAIEEGSTLVRIGTLLFGPRPARNQTH